MSYYVRKPFNLRRTSTRTLGQKVMLEFGLRANQAAVIRHGFTTRQRIVSHNLSQAEYTCGSAERSNARVFKYYRLLNI